MYSYCKCEKLGRGWGAVCRGKKSTHLPKTSHCYLILTPVSGLISSRNSILWGEFIHASDLNGPLNKNTHFSLSSSLYWILIWQNIAVSKASLVYLIFTIHCCWNISCQHDCHFVESCQSLLSPASSLASPPPTPPTPPTPLPAPFKSSMALFNPFVLRIVAEINWKLLPSSTLPTSPFLLLFLSSFLLQWTEIIYIWTISNMFWI